MRCYRLFLPGPLLLAATTLSFGQTVTPPSPPEVTVTEATPDRLLLKVGLNAGRALSWSGYNGLMTHAAVAVGAEYLLNSRFTLYSQVDADVALGRNSYYHGEGNGLISSGAVGIGGRYYYNQAGRVQHNRAHGPFVGNYLALEATTELNRRQFELYDYTSSYYPTPYTTEYRTQVTPLVTVQWGWQRRVGQHFLYDAGIGLGLLARPATYSYYPYSGHFDTLYRFESTLAINLRLYFVR